MHGNKLLTPDVKDANLEQKWRLFKAERLKIGHWCTRVAIWEELREDKGWKDTGPMGEVTPKQLLALYARIEEAKTQSERYAILAESVPEKAQKVADKPLVWFDIISGLTSPHIVQSVGQAAYELSDNGRHLWKKALDIGSGTDNFGAILLGKNGVPRSVQSLTAIDIERPLLGVAAKRYPETQHVQGDATRLPFPDSSFDLIVSGGLAYALERDIQADFFSEVARVLAPGGIYLDGDYENRYLHPDFRQAGPKYDLENFIVKTLSPLEILPPSELEGFQPEDFAKLGLEYSLREYHGTQEHEVTNVRVLQKPAA